MKSKLAKKSTSSNIIVALDIGTVNAKAIIADLRPKGLRILGVGRASQDLYDMQAGAIADIPAVVENCSRALARAETQAGQQPKLAVLGIAGELIKGITNKTRVQRAHPDQPLNSAELDKIIVASQVEAQKQAQHQVALEIGGKKVDLKLINSALIEITIDGYKVTNPIGFQGGSLETQLYTAFAPLVHTGAIERVARDLDLELLAVAAEPFAMARSVIGDDLNASLNAILIDIGGGTTDIAVLRDGGLEATRTFAIGGCSFSRAIARRLGVSYRQAEATKLQFSTGSGGVGELSPHVKKTVKETLTKTAEVWLAGIKMSFSEFSWLEYLPSQILLSGGGSGLKILHSQLNQPGSTKDVWHKQLPFSRRPQIKSIQVDSMPAIDDPQGLIDHHDLVVGLGLARVGRDTLQIDRSSRLAINPNRRRVSQILSN